jgi:hypothetical protein
LDDPLFEVGSKICCTCKVLKPLTEFNRLKKAKDGRQYSCRDCNKAYHYAHWDRHMAQIRRRSRERKAANQAFIIEYLKTHPCVDCGETDLLVLEFDHLRDKKENISRLIATHELKWLKEEIEKCDVVCANCHRRRTALRGNWYRTRRCGGPPGARPQFINRLKGGSSRN